MNTGLPAGRRAKVTPLHRAHPTPATFVKVGAVLAVITAVEFLILYVRGMSALVVTILAVLSAAKFFLVAAYFMHLRFDRAHPHGHLRRRRHPGDPDHGRRAVHQPGVTRLDVDETARLPEGICAVRAGRHRPARSAARPPRSRESAGRLPRTRRR